MIRFKRDNPCPICGGWEKSERGEGTRCWGYLTDDGQFAHCMREEFAHGIQQNDGSKGYVHWLWGPCFCGIDHSGGTFVSRGVTDHEALYTYDDEEGRDLFQVVRDPGKKFWQRRSDGAGGWTAGVKGVRGVIYRLHELTVDDSDRPIYIVEGEKDVDNLRKRGLLATCNPGGAGKWAAVASSAWAPLASRDVIIIADADEDGLGRKHALEVQANLTGHPRSMRLCECPPPHKDVSDLLSSGGNLDQLIEMQPYVPSSSKTNGHANGHTNGASIFAQFSPPTERKPLSPLAIIDRWQEEGPLIHVPTGLPTLDGLTGGGFTLGSRVYLVGAPDAGKTALAVQLADVFSARGLAVGILAVDEDPDPDVQTRLAQRRGFSRRQCEERSKETLQALHTAFADVSVRMYDAMWTIEAAASNLAAYAKESGKTGSMLVVDSIQSVSSEALTKRKDDVSERQIVNANVRAVRETATAYRMLVVATSEMNRGSYRSIEAVEEAESAGNMASAKESGAIEYSARVMLVLRSVKNVTNLLSLGVAKNKHGPSGTGLFLEINRDKMAITECSVSPDLVSVAASKPSKTEQKNTDKKEAKINAAADAAVAVIYNKPGIGKVQLRTHVSAQIEGGCAKDTVDVAVARCVEGGRVVCQEVSSREIRYYPKGWEQVGQNEPQEREISPHTPQSAGTPALMGVGVESAAAKNGAALSGTHDENSTNAYKNSETRVPAFSGTHSGTHKIDAALTNQQAEEDADELYRLPDKQWKTYMSSKPWGPERRRLARQVAAERVQRAIGDADVLRSFVARGIDPKAYAEEKGWPERRLGAALWRLELSPPATPSPWDSEADARSLQNAQRIGHDVRVWVKNEGWEEERLNAALEILKRSLLK